MDRRRHWKHNIRSPISNATRREIAAIASLYDLAARMCASSPTSADITARKVHQDWSTVVERRHGLQHSRMPSAATIRCVRLWVSSRKGGQPVTGDPGFGELGFPFFARWWSRSNGEDAAPATPTPCRLMMQMVRRRVRRSPRAVFQNWGGRILIRTATVRERLDEYKHDPFLTVGVRIRAHLAESPC